MPGLSLSGVMSQEMSGQTHSAVEDNATFGSRKVKHLVNSKFRRTFWTFQPFFPADAWLCCCNWSRVHQPRYCCLPGKVGRVVSVVQEENMMSVCGTRCPGGAFSSWPCTGVSLSIPVNKHLEDPCGQSPCGQATLYTHASAVNVATFTNKTFMICAPTPSPLVPAD